MGFPWKRSLPWCGMSKEQGSPQHKYQVACERPRRREGCPLDCWGQALSLSTDRVCIWKKGATGCPTVLREGSLMLHQVPAGALVRAGRMPSAACSP